jgi:hypothetical protein
LGKQLYNAKKGFSTIFEGFRKETISITPADFIGDYEEEFEKDLHYDKDKVYNKENELIYSSTSARRVLDISTTV